MRFIAKRFLTALFSAGLFVLVVSAASAGGPASTVAAPAVQKVATVTATATPAAPACH